MVESIGFPSLPSNPFDQSPLEADDRDLLVGRSEAVEALHWELKDASGFSMVLLTGPPGSGRTSLMRVLAAGVRRSTHIVSVDQGPGEVANLIHQIHQAFVKGEAPASVDEAMRQIKATLRRDTSPALVVLDLPSLDGARLPTLLSTAMPYLERLPAVFVVVTTPAHAARFGDVQSKFSGEISLGDLSMSAISDLIDARVRRQSPSGWRPHATWIEANLGHVPPQPRDIVAHLRKAFDAHRRGSSTAGGAPAAPSVLGAEANGGTYFESVEAHSLDFDMSMLDGDRERDAPLPLRPHEQNVESAGLWYEGIGSEPADDEGEAGPWVEEDTIEEDPAGSTDQPTSAAPLPVISPDVQAPSKPLPSSGVGRGFGRLSHRSSETKAGIEDAREAEASTRPLPDPHEVRDEANVFTDLTGGRTNVSESALGSSVSLQKEASSQEHNLSIADQRSLQQLARLLHTGVQQMDRSTVEQGLAGALMALGAPLPSAVQHRPLRTDALKGLNRGGAVVVEVASKRPLSPSDTSVLQRLGIKRARLSQICNGLHRDGVLDVAVQGRQRVYTLSLAARGQLQSWGFPVGEDQ